MREILRDWLWWCVFRCITQLMEKRKAAQVREHKRSISIAGMHMYS